MRYSAGTCGSGLLLLAAVVLASCSSDDLAVPSTGTSPPEVVASTSPTQASPEVDGLEIDDFFGRSWRPREIRGFPFLVSDQRRFEAGSTTGRDEEYFLDDGLLTVRYLDDDPPCRDSCEKFYFVMDAETDELVWVYGSTLPPPGFPPASQTPVKLAGSELVVQESWVDNPDDRQRPVPDAFFTSLTIECGFCMDFEAFMGLSRSYTSLSGEVIEIPEAAQIEIEGDTLTITRGQMRIIAKES